MASHRTTRAATLAFCAAGVLGPNFCCLRSDFTRVMRTPPGLESSPCQSKFCITRPASVDMSNCRALTPPRYFWGAGIEEPAVRLTRDKSVDVGAHFDAAEME